MPLTYGLKNAADMLAKLHREHGRLKRKLTPDGLFNFVVTAYHIADWVEKDPEVPKAARSELPAVRDHVAVRTCRDLANASKHFSFDKNYKNRVTAKTSVIAAHLDDMDILTEHGESIAIVLNDGQRFNASALAQDVVDLWDEFFREHGLR